MFIMSGIASVIPYGEYTLNDLSAMLGDEKQFPDADSVDGQSDAQNSQLCAIDTRTPGCHWRG